MKKAIAFGLAGALCAYIAITVATTALAQNNVARRFGSIATRWQVSA